MGDCYICGEETDRGKKNFALGEWIYLCCRACDDEYEPYEAESFEPTITDYKLIKNQEIDGEQMKITVDYQGMPYSGILDGGYWDAESFGAEKKDFQCYRCGKYYDTNKEAKECAKDDILFDRDAESFDADWSNAPYGSWDEAWSDQVAFTQSKGYFRPRNLALAGLAYWVAMKLRK